MEIVATLVYPLVPFAILAALALRFGRDSRPVFDGRPERRDKPPNTKPFRGA